jgi:uncharacterized membrane protein (DUF485 family)
MIGEPAVFTDFTPTEEQWKGFENDPDFQALVSDKMRFIIPATIVFVVYYFALPVLVGYFPTFMETKVIGNINLAYLFALSEFAMAFIITYLYARRAKTWDDQSEKLIAKFKGGAR